MIVLAGKRVAQLQQGATPKVTIPDEVKHTSIAMQEIIEGKIDFKILGKAGQVETES